MSEILIVIKREFLERVRAKSFLIGTFLFPLLIVGVYAIPFLVGSEGGERKLALVDEAPPGVGDRFVAILSAARTEGQNRYTVERVPGTLAEGRGELTSRVQAEEIDGYLALPANVVESNQIVYRARNITNIDVLKDIDRAASEAVQAERLRRAGLDGAEVAALVRSVDVSTARITERGEEGGSALSTFIFAYVVAFLIYFLTIFYGMNVMRSVLEEKTNRIAEVIVSSMKASHLMAGKIIGVGSVALVQVGIWALFLLLVATQSELIVRRFALPPGALNALKIDPVAGLGFATFFLLGFFFYSALFAALGAAVTSEQEAQSLQMFVMLPLILPLMFLVPITTEPLGRLATLLGLFPLTSAMVMPMRMAATEIPAVQVIGSLALLLLAVAAVAWLAGKIYRVGILSTGKKPTLRELGRWLRAA